MTKPHNADIDDGQTIRVIDDRVPPFCWQEHAFYRHYAGRKNGHGIGSHAIALYAVLTHYADRDGKAWPSLETLAIKLAANVKTVRKAALALKAAGLIKIIQGKKADKTDSVNIYRLLPVKVPDVKKNNGQSPSPHYQNRPSGTTKIGLRTRTSVINKNQQQQQRAKARHPGATRRAAAAGLSEVEKAALKALRSVGIRDSARTRQIAKKIAGSGATDYAPDVIRAEVAAIKRADSPIGVLISRLEAMTPEDWKAARPFEGYAIRENES